MAGWKDMLRVIFRMPSVPKPPIRQIALTWNRTNAPNLTWGRTNQPTLTWGRTNQPMLTWNQTNAPTLTWKP